MIGTSVRVSGAGEGEACQQGADAPEKTTPMSAPYSVVLSMMRGTAAPDRLYTRYSSIAVCTARMEASPYALNGSPVRYLWSAVHRGVRRSLCGC